tara:strand:+ start:321 stop:602 length:282 start_codon:yes stop_codon:yes gene_type:complete
MTLFTKGMGAIIKNVTKKRGRNPNFFVSPLKDAVRKKPLKKKSLLDITPRKIIKNVSKDVKAVAKNKTLVTGTIAAGVNEVVKNEKKKKNEKK